MNKKTLLILPLTSLILSGCVMYNGKDPNQSDTTTETTSPEETLTSETSSSETSSSDDNSSSTSNEPIDPNKKVTIYLVLGQYGLYNGNKGQDIDEKCIENALVLTNTVGSALPTSNEITSTVTDSTFQCWQSYDGGGATKEYTTVPNEDGKILYALFTGGSGSGTTPAPGPDSGSTLPSSGYGILFSDNKYAVGTLQSGTDSNGRTQYLISNYSFKANEQFKIYDFTNKAGWVENLDPYSFGGNETNLKWKTYLEKGTDYYKVLVDFKANVYLKLMFNDNQIYFGLSS